MRHQASVFTLRGDERTLLSAISGTSREGAIESACAFATKYEREGWAITTPEPGRVRCERDGEIREILAEEFEA